MTSLDRLSKILNRAADYITEEYPEAVEQQLDICIMNAESMAHLNESFVNHEGVTDVITFDFRDEMYDESCSEEVAGEIYVCPAVAHDRAEEFGNCFDDELILYMIHGMLHLFGYNDKTDEDQADMTLAEQRSMSWIKEMDDLKGVFVYNA